MAEIVLGIGTSHAPQLSTPQAYWPLHAERDRRDQVLWFRGERYDFDTLVKERAGEELGRHVDEESWQAKQSACDQAIRHLSSMLLEADADVVVVVGDDQRELFLEDNTPAIALYGGEHLISFPRDPDSLHPALRAAGWAMWGDAPVSHRCAASLGRHLAQDLVDNDFDVTYCAAQPEGRSLGHAFNFIFSRLLPDVDRKPLLAPVFLNTYYPPNRPAPSRVYRAGRALGRALSSWEEDARICVIASGGLSHFVVDEALDRRILDGIAGRDEGALVTLPNEWMISGSAEILNWICVAGALTDRSMQLVDYVPIYRTEAGTGCGMAFALWT